MAFDLNSNRSAQQRTVIFDLDGTLIDSQESILNSMRIALGQIGIEAKIPINKDLVGPPLTDTLSKLTGSTDQLILNKIGNLFKLHYDTIGYKATIVYPGVVDLLKRLINQGFTLYVCTNKRLIPTSKIVDHLAWSNFFSAIYSIDLYPDLPFNNKTEMISFLLKNESIDINLAVYVGDRLEDYEASKRNNMRCILVDWGYGVNIHPQNSEYLKAKNSLELQNTIESLW